MFYSIDLDVHFHFSISIRIKIVKTHTKKMKSICTKIITSIKDGRNRKLWKLENSQFWISNIKKSQIKQKIIDMKDFFIFISKTNTQIAK